MSYEESIVVRELWVRVNQRLREMNIKDKAEGERVVDQLVEDIRYELSHDSSLVPAAVKEQIYNELRTWKESRETTTQLVRSEVRQAFDQQFRLSDRLLAFAELEAVRFEKLFASGFQTLYSKTPRPDPAAVTGAPLKCLLLLSLYSKMCTIVTEILCLMKENLLDGAESRLRTLHEHVIVATLITNDHTYELSERYQDHAVFEDLKRLRAIRKNIRDSIYIANPKAEKELDDQIADSEQAASLAQARWGANIKEQNEWARPGLSAIAQKKRSISFTDLELAAGSEFLRPDYLAGNNYVHAGAFAAINHLNLGDSEARMVKSRNYRADQRLTDIGMRATRYLGWATFFVGESISTETEQYDELLVVYEIIRAADEACRSFTIATTPLAG
jgi:hypothetical protein